MSAESNERLARLGNIAKKLFPTVMQKILKECISPRGLQVKYQLNNIPADFTENEITLMENLPNFNNFTTELCFKILRFENLLHEPSCKWGNSPHDTEVEIGDDVQRILNATNDVIIRKTEEISELYYEEFKNRIQEVLKRVDEYLCQDTCIQLYQTIDSSDINITDMLQELTMMQKINAIHIVDEESEKLERYSRVSRVITDTFPNILRDIISSNITASNLYQMCLSYLNDFTSDQKTSLNDLKSSNSYESMDITLIYKLLRQFSLISSPTKGWGSNPDKIDIKLADDVERIRRYRNQIAHRCDTNIEKDEFDEFFNNFRHIGLRMDLNFFHKRNYEQLIVRHKTCSMDMQMQTKYKNALKQLENIRLQFEERPLKFFWGESFDNSLRDLRTFLKNEKSEEGRRKVRVQIIFQNEENVEATIDILNSLKDEINKDLSGIEFIVATKGSIVLHVEILVILLETDQLLQSTLALFFRKILERITTFDAESIDLVLIPVQDFKQWNAPTTTGEPVYLEFDIEAELFKTNDNMEEQFRKISDAIIKHSDGSGTNNNITATLLPICLEEEASYAQSLISEENTRTTEESFTQAQTPVKYNLPVSVTLCKKLNIKKLTNEDLFITTCIKTGNTLVFTDCDNNRLIICNSDGTDIHHIPLSYKPCYITEIDSNTVAVSCLYDRTIQIINISTRSVTCTINPSGYCYGISLNNNNLYVVVDHSIIHVMDLTGKVIRTIPTPTYDIYDITVDRDRLVCIDYTSIYCCSLDGKVIWQFEKDEFQDLTRVTTDNEGNVYITDWRKSTVLVVSDDGQHHKELLTKSDGLDWPRGIYFDKKETILLVCNERNGKAFLFEVKKNKNKHE
ncbi:Hypothetical predicted protein [Mytilus galloprovincialis]|uniref:DZIP3-like HEPN domain-containing protein n=2 Tax=Mytilus galloprovincialis TaxID=29158 RepID=A0A8B6EUY4_MYTGA|nr:Hypothetical predicted protein [Mytilus galloprovincialis]